VVGWSGTAEAETQEEQVMNVGQMVISCQACGQDYYFDCPEYLAWHVAENCPGWSSNASDLSTFRARLSEVLEERLESWGFNAIEAIPYSENWNCPHKLCEHKWPNDREKRWQHVAGFHYHPFHKLGRDFAGEVIIECPSCGRKYWFHVDRLLVAMISKISASWPPE